MKRQGFTVIELLVVTAMISLFVAILVPCFRVLRERAKCLRCSSNIRQLTLGLSMYEAENGGFPHALDETRLEPPPGGYPGYAEHDRIGWWWFNQIVDYSKKARGAKSLMWCPSRKLSDAGLKGDVLCSNYGVNRSICKTTHGRKGEEKFVGAPLCGTEILRADETLLVADSGYSMITWWHATDAPPVAFGQSIEETAYVPGLWINKTRDLWPGQEEDAISGRHPNKTVNVGFADGHISRKKADDLYVEKTDDGYKNRYPLWQPE